MYKGEKTIHELETSIGKLEHMVEKKKKEKITLERSWAYRKFKKNQEKTPAVNNQL